MIARLRLKFGRAATVPAQNITVTPVTVFVGPNNSGKSKILSEIHHYCSHGQKDATAVILDELELVGIQADAVDDAISHVTLQPNFGEAVAVDHLIIGGRGERRQVHRESLKSTMAQPSHNLAAYCQWFLRYS